MDGWIKLHRKTLEWEWFFDGYTFRVFVYLLLTASNQKTEVHGIKISAGECVCNIPQISASIHMSENWVRRSLNNLVSTGEIKISSDKVNARYRIVTIANWKKYQFEPHDVNLTTCTSQCEPHSEPHNVRGIKDDLYINHPREEREEDSYNAHANEHHNMNHTPCTSQCAGQKNDDDIPSEPFKPNQGIGAPPIIPYPNTTKEVITEATRQGLVMTEDEAGIFLSHYQGTSWMAGSTRITDWRMILKTWTLKSKSYNRSINNGNPRQQGYDRKRVASSDEFGESDPY